MNVRVRRFLVVLPTGRAITVETGGTKRDAIEAVASDPQLGLSAWAARRITAQEIR